MFFKESMSQVARISQTDHVAKVGFELFFSTLPLRAPAPAPAPKPGIRRESSIN